MIHQSKTSGKLFVERIDATKMNYKKCKMERIEWIEKYLADAERMIYEGELENGLNVLDKLLYEEPGYGSLHNHIGWAHLYHTRNTAKSERHLKLAITFDDEFAHAYLHLGCLYIRLARYSEAIGYLKIGLTKVNANKLAILQNMAHAYEMLGKFSEAIKAYREAMIVSTAEYEIDQLQAGIKRCRKKRVVLFFTL